MDNHDLIAASRAGDGRALDALLRKNYDRIWALCRRLAGNDADAQDATQEALIAIARGIPRFDGRSTFSTWAYRVATNACLDELRRRSRRPVPADSDAVTAAVADTAPVQVDDRLAIDHALGHLQEDHRVVVVLRDLCDLSYTEIGHILDLPPGTVRSRISRGRSQLARILGETGNQRTPGRRPSSQP